LRRVYFQRLDFEAARASLTAWTERSRGCQPARDLLAQLWLRKGDRAKAQEIWRASLAADPQWAPAQAGLGSALLADNHPQEAETYLRNALLLDASDVESWVALGRALRAQHKIEDAEACWTQALALQPNHVAAAALLRESRAAGGSGKQ
jgi:predicted Zn-dependent protease